MKDNLYMFYIKQTVKIDYIENTGSKYNLSAVEVHL